MALLSHVTPAMAQSPDDVAALQTARRDQVETFTVTGSAAAEPLRLVASDNGGPASRSVIFDVDERVAATTAFSSANVVITDVTVLPNGDVLGITLRSLWRFDRTTGLSYEVGVLGERGANALTADSQGRVFGATNEGVFFEVDPRSGRTRRIGAFGRGLESSGDLAFAPDGTLFATVRGMSSDSLAVVDQATGRATLLGALGYPEVWGLAFAPDGLLYASAYATDTNATLLRIDIAARTLTPVPVAGARGLTGLGAIATGARALESPGDLRATVTGQTVALDWTPVSGATSYVLEVGGSTGRADIAVVDVGDVVRFSAVAPNGTYVVRVRARRGAETSGPSPEATVLVGATCPRPAAPGALTSARVGSQLTLQWSGSSDAAGYILEAGTAPGLTNVATIATGRATSLAVSLSGVPAGTYYLRVRAVSACGVGASSADASVTVP